MSGTPKNSLPGPAANCQVTVCIPARDEAQFITQTLEALVRQRDIDRSPFAHHVFDVIVFANNCSDATAAVVRSIAARNAHVQIFVLEETLASDEAHIGTARKRVLDLAAARFMAAGKPNGIVASLDSDTMVSDDWIAWLGREMRGRDAVAGHVTIAPADQERLLAPVRLLYARELAYRRILAEVEALIDPRPEDPLPRHGSFVGASFAVTARCYTEAGGLPVRPRLEDVEFARVLQRIDARVRYSPFVRSTTSARLDCRVEGGFGTFIGDLNACARRGESFNVEHPLRTLEDIETRAVIRRIRNGDERPDDVKRMATILALPTDCWRPFIERHAPVGAIYERIVRRAEAGRRSYPAARVEFAITILRAAAVRAKTRQLLTPSGDAFNEFFEDEDAG